MYLVLTLDLYILSTCRFAASVDEVLNEDDMAFSEPLKEYLHFADVLK